MKKSMYEYLKQIKNVKGQIPYDGDYSNSEHDFRWYEIKNMEDWKTLCLCFEVPDYMEKYITVFPEWVCFEDDDNAEFDFEHFHINGNPEDIRITTLTECKKAFANLLNAFEVTTTDNK